MTVGLDAATSFMATHARTMDRRRFHLLLGEPDPTGALHALAAYVNPDGGYGWALEPDLRSTESQPVGAMHAFEVFEEIAPETAPQAVQLCDWLESVSFDDGGLPFAFPVGNPAGCAPWWAQADGTTSSLHITTAVASVAHRVARHDHSVAKHAWLEQATRYCMQTIEAMDRPGHALELLFALAFLDSAYEREPKAGAALTRLGAAIPAGGAIPVEGGTEEEMIRPIDLAPTPDRPVRDLFAPEAISADLERLAGLQQGDGGWPVEWATSSPASALEWRGYLTVRALSILQRNGVVDFR